MWWRNAGFFSDQKSGAMMDWYQGELLWMFIPLPFPNMVVEGVSINAKMGMSMYIPALLQVGAPPVKPNVFRSRGSHGQKGLIKWCIIYYSKPWQPWISILSHGQAIYDYPHDSGNLQGRRSGAWKSPDTCRQAIPPARVSWIDLREIEGKSTGYPGLISLATTCVF